MYKMKTFEVWIEGTVGLHKNKPVMYGVYQTQVEATRVMSKILKRGEFASIVVRDSSTGEEVDRLHG
tara:strand:- start:527 stop:727 length:201 start_codon:yes stop_codon:yes gene_type:complete